MPLRPLIVLWLGAPSALTAHEPDLTRWALERGRTPTLRVDPHQAAAYALPHAERIEQLLEEARRAAPASAEQLQRLEQLILAHPELPQAAWWMAERHALAAQQPAGDAATPPSAALAAARRLEGPRATVFGGPSLPDGLAPDAAALEVTGLRPSDQLFLDGIAVTAGARVDAGRHHAQTFRQGRRLWAAWVELGTPPVLDVIDPTEACSELDLLGTRSGPKAPQPAPGILCSQWAAARPSAAGGTDVAVCVGSSCAAWQPLFEGRPRLPSAALLPVARDDASAGTWPTWATWSAVGLASVLTTGLILWQTGAFDQSPRDTEFVFTGPSAGAFEF